MLSRFLVRFLNLPNVSANWPPKHLKRTTVETPLTVPTVAVDGAPESALGSPSVKETSTLDTPLPQAQKARTGGPVFLNGRLGSLLGRIALTILLYVLAILARDLVNQATPIEVRYITFFPALLAAGFSCGLVLSSCLLAAFAVTAIFDLPPTSIARYFFIEFSFVLAGAAIIIPALYAVRVRSRLEQHEKRLELINHELRHRLKNLLTVIKSICVHSVRPDASSTEIKGKIAGRIDALAAAQDFLSVTSDRSDLQSLVLKVIGPLSPDAARMRVAGPSVSLPSASAVSFALLLHELATNAVKYGAWRLDSTGQVVVDWELLDGELRLRWLEKGVRCSPSDRHGFGTTLIERGLSGATVQHEIRSTGAECKINMQL